VSVLRVIGAVIGGVLALAVSGSVLRVLITPRARPGGVFGRMQRVVGATYRAIVGRLDDYNQRDRVLATKAPVILVLQLAVWLVGYLVAFALLLWPHTDSLGRGFAEAGSSMFTLGYVAPHGDGTGAVDVMASVCGLVVITLQIAYLPSLYGAFNRRETLVALLYSRAGLPPWGPEILARTKYGIAGDRDDLPRFYAAWESWAADVAESHSNYPVLVQFRSPHAMTSWLIGLLAVMDSAALLLAVAPSRDRIEPRLCLRMGFTALRQIADATGIHYDPDPDPDCELLLTFAEFEAGMQRLLDVGFEVERDAEAAWPQFRGWRINYESIAYALAAKTDAVPALWSGSRSWRSDPMPPSRPANRKPTTQDSDRAEAR
jgi:hypothetical protein